MTQYNVWWVWLLIGVILTLALLFMWSKFIVPLLKRQVNIVITGAAGELDALADSIRNHQWKMGRGEVAVLKSSVGRFAPLKPAKVRKRKVRR